MKNLKNRKGFTLVELLAVIVVLAIVMGLAVVAITGVLDNARKATFAADAKSFLEGAHSLVNADDINNMIGTSSSAKYAPDCKTNSTPVYITIALIKLQQGGTKSPYGNTYVIGEATEPSTSAPTTSHIKVEATLNTTTGECNYTFGIYLSDSVYAIGSASELVPESSVAAGEVKVIGS